MAPSLLWTEHGELARLASAVPSSTAEGRARFPPAAARAPSPRRPAPPLAPTAAAPLNPAKTPYAGPAVPSLTPTRVAVSGVVEMAVAQVKFPRGAPPQGARGLALDRGATAPPRPPAIASVSATPVGEKKLSDLAAVPAGLREEGQPPGSAGSRVAVTKSASWQRPTFKSVELNLDMLNLEAAFSDPALMPAEDAAAGPAAPPPVPPSAAPRPASAAAAPRPASAAAAPRPAPAAAAPRPAPAAAAPRPASAAAAPRPAPAAAAPRPAPAAAAPRPAPAAAAPRPAPAAAAPRSLPAVAEPPPVAASAQAEGGKGPGAVETIGERLRSFVVRHVESTGAVAAFIADDEGLEMANHLATPELLAITALMGKHVAEVRALLQTETEGYLTFELDEEHSLGVVWADTELGRLAAGLVLSNPLDRQTVKELRNNLREAAKRPTSLKARPLTAASGARPLD